MENQQVDILKTLYSQQQSTAHILRDKMSKITTGTTGLLLAIDGWLITGQDSLSNAQVTMLTVSIIVIVAVAIYGVHARYREFSAVARLIVRIETAMKIFEPGAYLEEDSLYPESFKNLGTDGYEHGKNIFLSQAAVIVIFGLLSIGLALYS